MNNTDQNLPAPSSLKYFAATAGLALLASALIMLLSSNFVNNTKTIKKYSTVRDVIITRLTSLVTTPLVIQMAGRSNFKTPGNKHLTNCLFEEGSCTITNPAEQVEFVLPKGLTPDSPILAGTHDQAGAYSPEGEQTCTDAPCEGWHAFTSFWAICPDEAKQCAKAERLMVRFQVVPSENFLEGQTIGRYPSESEFSNKTKFAHSSPVR